MINFSVEDFIDKEETYSGYVSNCTKIYPSLKVPVTIPKIIYQSWKTHEVPPKWASSPESIKCHMSDWKYVLFNDEENRNLVEKYFPDFLPYYDSFPHNIQRADAARYCFLYIFGGLYLDLDYEVNRNLSPLFASGDIFLVCSGNVSSYYTNSVMASKPRHPFWLEVIEEMKQPEKWWYIGKHFQVMEQSGPLMLSRVTRKTKHVISVLPKRLVIPCSICNLNCSTCESYLRPLIGCSWISYDTMFYNFWLCHWKKVVSFVICLLILLLIVWILYQNGIMNETVYPSDLFNFFRNILKK